MGVSDDFFDAAVSAVRISVGDAVPGGVMREPFDCGIEMAFLLVEEALPISNEILKVPDLRAVHGGVVDLGKNAIPNGKPDPAGCGVRGADTVLAPVGPVGLNARPPD